MMQNYSLIKYFVYLFPRDKANLLKVIIFVDDTSNNLHIILSNAVMTPIEKLDKIDLQILRLMQQNARLTIKELGQEVNLSSTPVYERLKRLERDGYIKKYVALLDEEKLNQGFIVFCNVKLRQTSLQRAQEFVETIRQIPQVTECYNISGRYDYLMKIHAANMKAYQELILNVLGSIDSVASLESTFVMDEVKNEIGVAIQI